MSDSATPASIRRAAVFAAGHLGELTGQIPVELVDAVLAETRTTERCLANEENGFSWIADTGAAGTIAQLQSEGYTVTITRAGTGPLDQCRVTEVRNPNTTTYTTRSHSGAGGVNTIVVSKTIDVTLDCT